MIPAKKTALFILPCLLLAGCATNDTDDDPQKDFPLSSGQISACLERAKPPQQFGFQVFAQQDGISYIGRGRLHPNHFSSAEVLEENIPAIRMRGRSSRDRMNVLIDVSSPVSWMEFLTSQDFKAIFMGINGKVVPYRGNYNTGGVPAFAAIVTQLRIDNLFIEAVPFYVRMAEGSLGPLIRGIDEPGIDAILGYDNLQSFEYIQFDLEDDTIIFSATQPYRPNDALLVETAKIIRVPGHGLAIEGIIDDELTPIILDFAGDYSLACGGIKTNTTRYIELGHMLINDVPTLALPRKTIPPRVGRKLLEPYVVTICNKKGVVYFEQYPEEPEE